MFRFTVRELVLATVIVGLALSLWLARSDRDRWKSVAQGLETAMRFKGWSVQRATNGGLHLVAPKQQRCETHQHFLIG
jgi:hypothetical protein